MDKKYWIYINKFSGLVRDFGDRISIRCENMEDAETIAKLLKKIGHEGVLTAESVSCITTNNDSNSPDGEVYY